MKILLAVLAAIFLAVTPVRAGDTMLTLEFGVGLGPSGPERCGYTMISRMLFAALRYRIEDVEVHGARWFRTSGKSICDRDNIALGVGYAIDTEREGAQNNKQLHALWTPGAALLLKPNYKLGHFALFNRVAVGYEATERLDLEAGYNVYGGLFSHHSEHFGSLGFRINHRTEPTTNIGQNPGLSESTPNPPTEPPTEPPTPPTPPVDPPVPPTPDPPKPPKDPKEPKEPKEPKQPKDPKPPKDGDHDRGHGNDDDRFDEDNPGKKGDKDGKKGDKGDKKGSKK